MAEVILQIGDRSHRIACKDGSEDQVRRMGALLNARWPAANRASGGLNAERSMLFIALMLADALDEAARRPDGDAAVPVASETPPPAPMIAPELLDRIADRLEAIAAALEKSAAAD